MSVSTLDFTVVARESKFRRTETTSTWLAIALRKQRWRAMRV